MTNYATTPNIQTRLLGYDTTYELTTPTLLLALDDADQFINRRLDEENLSFTSTPKQLVKAAEYYACGMILVNFSDTSSDLPASAIKYFEEAEKELNGYVKANSTNEDNSPYHSSRTPIDSSTDYNTDNNNDEEDESFNDILDGEHYGN